MCSKNSSLGQSIWDFNLLGSNCFKQKGSRRIFPASACWIPIQNAFEKQIQSGYLAPKCNILTLIFLTLLTDKDELKKIARRKRTTTIGLFKKQIEDESKLLPDKVSENIVMGMKDYTKEGKLKKMNMKGIDVQAQIRDWDQQFEKYCKVSKNKLEFLRTIKDAQSKNWAKLSKSKTMALEKTRSKVSKTKKKSKKAPLRHLQTRRLNTKNSRKSQEDYTSSDSVEQETPSTPQVSAALDLANMQRFSQFFQDAQNKKDQKKITYEDENFKRFEQFQKMTQTQNLLKVKPIEEAKFQDPNRHRKFLNFSNVNAIRYQKRPKRVSARKSQRKRRFTMPYVKPMSHHDLQKKCDYLVQKINDEKLNGFDYFAMDMLESKKKKDKAMVRALGKDFFETTMIDRGEEIGSFMSESCSTLDNKKKIQKMKAKQAKANEMIWVQKIVERAAKINSFQKIIETGRIWSKSDVFFYDEDKERQPLYYAIKNQNLRFVRFLFGEPDGEVDYDPSSDFINPDVPVDRRTQNTPLHVAFSTGNIMIVMFLVRKGASLNLLNRDNNTPLAYDTARLCKKLNLMDGVTTTNWNHKWNMKNFGNRRKKFDNNRFLFKKNKEHDGIAFRHRLKEMEHHPYNPVAKRFYQGKQVHSYGTCVDEIREWEQVNYTALNKEKIAKMFDENMQKRRKRTRQRRKKKKW